MHMQSYKSNCSFFFFIQFIFYSKSAKWLKVEKKPLGAQWKDYYGASL